MSLLLKKVKLLALKSIFSSRATLKLKKPMVSFTFDDVPLSAVIQGGAILEKYGFRGTYYVSMGIQLNKNSPVKLSMNDIIKLIAERGHEIGCHTYTHKKLRWTSSADTLTNCQQNLNAINQVLPGYIVKSFSYPYGSVGFTSKRALQTLYSTMRTSYSGINQGKLDLSHLRGINLYSKNFDRKRIKKILTKNKMNRSWTIFYTHSVSDDFGSYGTSPQDFDWVVAQCSNGDFDVVKMSQALRKIQF